MGITTDLKTLATNVAEDFEKLNMSTKELLIDSDLHDVKFSKEVIFDVETLPTITTEIKTLVKNVTKKLPTTTTKITKSDERNTEASGEEKISTAELSTDLDSDDISFSTKGVTELDKIAILAKNDSIVPTLSTELKTVDQNVTELSIEDKISKFSTKEKIKSDYITTISTVTTDLEKLDEKVAEASVEDKISTEIMFTDFGSSDIPFSTESVMDVDKLFTTESRELDKSTEEIITKFASSGVYLNTDGIKDDSKMSTLLQTDFITEIPFITTDLTTLATNVTEDFEKLEISTEELLTDSDLDDVSFSKKVISDIDEVTIFSTNLTLQTSHATTLPTKTFELKTFDEKVTQKLPAITTKFTKLDGRITEASGEEEISTAELSTDSGSNDVSFDERTIVSTNLTLQTSYATTLPTLTTELKTFPENVTEKLPTKTIKFTKLDERISEASGEEEISTAELLTDLGSESVSFSTKVITELDKRAISSNIDAILPTIEDRISKFSTKEKIKSDN